MFFLNFSKLKNFKKVDNRIRMHWKIRKGKKLLWMSHSARESDEIYTFV